MKEVSFDRLLTYVVLFSCAAAWADPSAEVVDGKYVFSVPTNETYTLTADDVALAMTDANHVYPFTKKGPGTLVVGEVMADYTNDIYILEGQYKTTAKTAFGTTAGATHVDGGTIWSTVYGGSSNSAASYGSEWFYLKGTGYDNLGVIRQTGQSCYNFAGAGRITLDGDIRVTGTKPLEFRNSKVYCNGYKITASIEDSRYWFRFVTTTINGPGNIDVESGRFGFEGDTGNGDGEHSVTIRDGACLFVNNITKEQKRTLSLEDGAQVMVNWGGSLTKHVVGQITEQNLWSGDTTVASVTPVEFLNGHSRVLNFSAAISGAGGFSVTGGGYMQFSNTNNAFAGGVCVTGVVGPVDAPVTGGVSVVKTTSDADTFMVPFAAIPTNAAPIRIKDANFGIYNARIADVPDFYADGRSAITGDETLVRANLKSLTKTGSEELVLSGPIHVAGATEVDGGTLRFGTRVPDVPHGLDWYYQWGIIGSFVTNVPANVQHRAVDPAGAAYAYQAWPKTSGKSGASTHNQCHYYKGYIRIPGEEGEEVTCNFLSVMCRRAYVVIGDKTVVYMSDTTDKLTDTKLEGWSRIYVGPQVTLTAGWQPICIYMANSYDGTSGPLNYRGMWVDNFGLGVDWQARCATNSANYAQFVDPGDGSFLRPTLAGKADVDPSYYPRPSFGGSVAFTAGSVFDVNDVAPYTPVSIPSLIGAPTITNGEVHVVGTNWTLRAEDVAGGVPLTVTAGSTLKFAADTTFSLQDEDVISPRTAKTYPLLRVEDGGTLVNPPAYERAKGSKWFAEWSEDGKQLNLVYHSGFYLMIM